MLYNSPDLQLRADSVTDRLGTIHLRDLPDPQPSHPARLTGATPLVERLWRIALRDIESNIVETEEGRYFGAGKAFGTLVYTRDIAYAGTLSVNQLYPELIWRSLRVTRKVRWELGFRVSQGYRDDALEVDWQEEPISEKEFLQKYRSNNYLRRTDDVIWLWCAADLLSRDQVPRADDWAWLYSTGKAFFERFYQPFFDATDGLYRGQASFVDIHFADHPATGYPLDWTISDCYLGHALSTNCLYVLGLQAMANAANRLNLADESAHWQRRADELRITIARELSLPDGGLSYYKDRWNHLQPRRDALGLALAIRAGIIEGEQAHSYPATNQGVPLFDPFFQWEATYHNNAAWPFVDSLFLGALEQSDGQSRVARNAALLARCCVGDGSFREWVDLRTGQPSGSGSQLWSAAAWVGVCLRAGLWSASE